MPSVPITTSLIPVHGVVSSIQHYVIILVGRWFSLGTLVFSTNKTERSNITEILLKVVLNTNNPNH